VERARRKRGQEQRHRYERAMAMLAERDAALAARDARITELERKVARLLAALPTAPAKVTAPVDDGGPPELPA